MNESSGNAELPPRRRGPDVAMWLARYKRASWAVGVVLALAIPIWVVVSSMLAPPDGTEGPGSGGAERGLPQIVPQRDRFDEILVQPERPADGAGQLGHLEGVSQPVSAMVFVGRQDTHDCLLSKPTKCSTVDDPVAVSLELRAVIERATLVFDGMPSGRIA